MILFSNSSPATEAMLRTSAKVSLRVPVRSEVNLLTDIQGTELTTWEGEKYPEISLIDIYFNDSQGTELMNWNTEVYRKSLELASIKS